MERGAQVNKNDLKQYPYIRAELKQLEDEIAELRSAIESPPKTILDGMPKAKARNKDKMADLIAKLADLQTAYETKWDRLIELRREIETAIETLEPQDRLLMRYRYIEGMTWPRVTEKIYGYRPDFIDRFDSYRRTITNHHGSILNKLKHFPCFSLS